MGTRRIHAGRCRRGGVYLAVLGAAMVVCILGLSAMTVVRLEQVASEAGADSIKARAYAESAVELGMLEIRENTAWRLKPNGVWENAKPIGDGAYTLQVTDPYDGNLADNPREPVVVRGVGEKGQARHIIEVTMVDRGDAVTALTSALAAAGAFRVDNGWTLRVSGAPATSNGTLTNDGTIDGDAAALLVLGGGTITGSSSILLVGRTFPPAGVVGLYQDMGTIISPGAVMERVVLSPKHTTYGPRNKDGIYVITAAGGLTIRDVRIDGTLVVLAPGATVTIEGRVHLDSHRADCPALIVQGDLRLRFDSSQPLDEASAAFNFNPQDAPYLGASDADQIDQYPCEIRGLVHATGSLRVEQRARVVGCVVAEGTPFLDDGVRISGNAQIVHDAAIAERPPIGYSSTPRMEARPGSWTRVTLP